MTMTQTVHISRKYVNAIVLLNMAESEEDASVNYYGSSLFQSEESEMIMDLSLEESDESSEVNDCFFV